MLTHSRHKLCLLIATLALILALTVTPGISQFGAYAQTKSIVINNNATYANSTTVTLTLSSTNAVEMRFSNDNSEWSAWEAYATTKSWVVTAVEGEKTVYAQFKDSASNVVSTNDKIILDLTIPSANVVSWTTNKDTVTFDASQCSDSNGIVSYFWNYGDGATATGKIALHTYKEEGTYSGTLTIQDAAGNTGGTTFHIIIPYIGNSSSATSPNPNQGSSGNPTPTGTPLTSSTPTPLPEVHGVDIPLTWLLILAIVIIVAIVVTLAVVLRKKGKEPTKQQ